MNLLFGTDEYAICTGKCTEMVESIHMNEGRLLALNNNLTMTFSRETRSNTGSTISEHIVFSFFLVYSLRKCYSWDYGAFSIVQSLDGVFFGYLENERYNMAAKLVLRCGCVTQFASWLSCRCFSCPFWKMHLFLYLWTKKRNEVQFPSPAVSDFGFVNGNEIGMDAWSFLSDAKLKMIFLQEQMKQFRA